MHRHEQHAVLGETGEQRDQGQLGAAARRRARRSRRRRRACRAARPASQSGRGALEERAHRRLDAAHVHAAAEDHGVGLEEVRVAGVVGRPQRSPRRRPRGRRRRAPRPCARCGRCAEATTTRTFIARASYRRRSLASVSRKSGGIRRLGERRRRRRGARRGASRARRPRRRPPPPRRSARRRRAGGRGGRRRRGSGAGSRCTGRTSTRVAPRSASRARQREHDAAPLRPRRAPAPGGAAPPRARARAVPLAGEAARARSRGTSSPCGGAGTRSRRRCQVGLLGRRRRGSRRSSTSRRCTTPLRSAPSPTPTTSGWRADDEAEHACRAPPREADARACPPACRRRASPAPRRAPRARARGSAARALLGGGDEGRDLELRAGREALALLRGAARRARRRARGRARAGAAPRPARRRGRSRGRRRGARPPRRRRPRSGEEPIAGAVVGPPGRAPPAPRPRALLTLRGPAGNHGASAASS